MATCYLCNGDKLLTEDHVPPQCFFAVPRPKNLITVDCCQECHRTLSEIDRRVRNMFNMCIGNSVEKKWLFENKTFNDLNNGDRKFKTRLLERGFSWQINPYGGDLFYERVTQLSDDEFELINKFTIRVVKGLLRHFYPNYNYREDSFECCNIVENENFVSMLRGFGLPFVMDCRGIDAFKFLRYVDELKGLGLWILIFYGGSVYFVSHEHKPTVQKQSQ